MSPSAFSGFQVESLPGPGSRSVGPGSQLDFACRELFARPVRDEEVVAFREFAEVLRSTIKGDQKVVEQELWKAYARVLLGSNELLHID